MLLVRCDASISVSISMRTPRKDSCSAAQSEGFRESGQGEWTGGVGRESGQGG